MTKYRKKPVEVEAFKFYVDPVPDWFTDSVEANEIVVYERKYGTEGIMGFCTIKTLEGEMRGNAGDYIIKGVMGEIYPCKPDIFEATYEKV